MIYFILFPEKEEEEDEGNYGRFILVINFARVCYRDVHELSSTKTKPERRKKLFQYCTTLSGQ